MNIYPAIKASLGNWEYYIVKMSAKELSEQVYFAHEVDEDNTLDEAIQRILKETRVNQELVDYLSFQENRFFSSLVVAALDGSPVFTPLALEKNNRNKIFIEDHRFSDAFGALVFDGTQKYYALDGQHRLAAVKKLLDPNEECYQRAPNGFRDEEFSVIVVVPSESDNEETFLQKYRRLFSNLNRYAKPTDNATNIIMDEDDAIAIITRKLITENKFFRKTNEHNVVDTTAGKSMKAESACFTNIETLYQVNIELLSSKERITEGWFDGKKPVKKLENYKRFRPPEDVVESLYNEVTLYWAALLEVLPVLSLEAPKNRIHDSDTYKTQGLYKNDLLLFWPIGQELLGRIARKCFDCFLPNPEKFTKKELVAALSLLNKLEWRLHYPPWRYFLLTHKVLGRKNWNMRSEERGRVSKVAQEIMEWQLGINILNEHQIEKLYNEWKTRLIPQPRTSTINEYWEYTKNLVICN